MKDTRKVNNMGCGNCGDCGTERKNKTDEKTRHVPMYKCLLHNDDHNTMEHVAAVVQKVFAFNMLDSIAIMKEAHKTGIALCKVEVFEQAEFHCEQMQSYGLVASFEPE